MESTFAQALKYFNRHLHNYHHGHFISYSVNSVCPISRYKCSKQLANFTPSPQVFPPLDLHRIDFKSSTCRALRLHYYNKKSNVTMEFIFNRLIGEVISSSIPIYLCYKQTYQHTLHWISVERIVKTQFKYFLCML